MTIDATFWVAISFFIFIGVLIYLKVPQKINGSLNNRNAAMIECIYLWLSTLFVQYRSKEKNQDAPRPTSTCLDSSKLEKLTDFNF